MQGVLTVLLFEHSNMGRHKTWRKIAKKERRRRIRTQLAKKKDELYNSKDFLEENNLLEKLLYEQIEKSNDEENRKWIQAEEIAIKKWKHIQEEKEKLLQFQHEKEAKLKVEWELEEKKRLMEEERIKEAQEELKRKHEIFMVNLDKFLTGNSDEPPSELKFIRETRPNAELCPFFYKTACCRFGDQCSRNHQYPGISKVLIATNFYTHFGLNNANSNEYDTDIMLEYEDSDTYREFRDFFYDVISEFEKFGKISQFKDCRTSGSDRSRNSSVRSWRWSESPEHEVSKKTNSRSSENTVKRRRSSRDDDDYRRRRRRRSGRH